jgi:general secretion pathway protein G
MKLHRLRANRAFTLIELMVVILILAILAALIVPRIMHRVADAKRAKAKTDIETLSNLLQHYYVDTDQFPTSLQDLRVCPNGVNNWHGPYTTKNIPPDPWGHEYIYQCPGPNGTDYLITSYGPTGAPGGTGDDAAITSED